MSQRKLTARPNTHRRLKSAKVSGTRRRLYFLLRRTFALRFITLLFFLWLLFSAGLLIAERGSPLSSIQSYGQALYWGIAAFSTAGIADPPTTAAGRLVGGLWIISGSAIFFGVIVATITGYFMRPLYRPVHSLVDTIEYNLEHLTDLSIEELDLLKETTDSLILHVEELKKRHH